MCHGLTGLSRTDAEACSLSQWGCGELRVLWRARSSTNPLRSGWAARWPTGGWWRRWARRGRASTMRRPRASRTWPTTASGAAWGKVCGLHVLSSFHNADLLVVYGNPVHRLWDALNLADDRKRWSTAEGAPPATRCLHYPPFPAPWPSYCVPLSRTLSCRDGQHFKG